MKRWRTAVISFVVVCSFNVASGQMYVRSQIESVLDEGHGVDQAHDLILKISDDPVPILVNIAESDGESYVRRTRAIYLLATFKVPEAEGALAKMAEHGRPEFRCPALGALVLLKSQDAIPVLIGKLDDHAVCTKITSTDPPRERDVYVSDEAVRLLEEITRRSFDHESMTRHRATTPWKRWWSKQAKKSEH